MHRAVAALVLCPLAVAACRFEDGALGDAGVVVPPPGAEVDARPPPAPRPPLPPRDADPPDALVGAPAVIGCADGSREAFLNLQLWPGVAGCAGAWQVQGIVGASAATPRCDHTGGDDGSNAAGLGCAAADLCAAGWHVCRSPSELGRRSPTGCEAAVPPEAPAFYAIAIGATEAGTCLAAAAALNDVHGCGNVGLAEDAGCEPLVRRLGYADCLRSGGVWACGTEADATREAQLVTKEKPSGGGVICCLDEPPL